MFDIPTLLPELIWVLNLTPPALAPLKSNTIRVICVFAISEFLELDTICLMCFCYSYYYYYYSKSIGALRRKGRRRLGTAQNGGGRCSPRRGVQ